MIPSSTLGYLSDANAVCKSRPPADTTASPATTPLNISTNSPSDRQLSRDDVERNRQALNENKSMQTVSQYG